MKTSFAWWGVMMMPLCAAAEPLPDLRDAYTMGNLYSPEFALEGTRIVAGMSGGRVGVWETASGKPALAGELAELKETGAGSGHVLDARRQRVLVTVGDGRAAVYDLATGQALSPEIKRETSMEGRDLPAVFTPDGQVVMIGTAEGGYRVTKVESGQVLAQIAVPDTLYESEVVGLRLPQFSADGKFAFIIDGHGTLRRYATASWRESGPAMAHNPPIVGQDSCAFTLQRGGNWAATFNDAGDCGGTGLLRLWSTVDGQALGEPIEGSWGIGASFIGSGTRLLIRPGQGETRIVDLRRPEYLIQVPRHDDFSASMVLVIGNGSAALSWMNDQKLTRTPLDGPSTDQVSYEAAGRIVQVLEGPERESLYVAVDSTTYGEDTRTAGHVLKLDARTLEKKGELRLEDDGECNLKISAEGGTLMLEDRRLKLIATETMEEMGPTKPRKKE